MANSFIASERIQGCDSVKKNRPNKKEARSKRKKEEPRNMVVAKKKTKRRPA